MKKIVSKTLNCLVVEDEPLAAEGLAEYINTTPFLTLHTVCNNAIDASGILHNHQIDVLFLDVHLPIVKGVDFLRTLIKPPQVILTTAYQHYALEGYELNIVDYLLKPFSYTRFLAAVSKVKHDNAQNQMNRTFHFFTIDKKRVKIFEDEIIYAESLKEYVRITTINRSIITKMSLTELEATLDTSRFIRVHKSFIVSTDKIDAYNSSSIESGTYTIPIGRTFKESVTNMLNSL
ncbi:MAG: LytTR family DNA-binding domain-containing protein [Candidatus Kapaibacterium sp.]